MPLTGRVLKWLARSAVPVLCCLCLPDAGTAQNAAETGSLPAVFRALEGVWEGTGMLLGQPAAFHMDWRPASGGFVRLSFANGFVDPAGNRTPVLQSEATYLVRGESISGVWIDSRPQTIRLTAVASDTSLVTTWTADEERGRTEYVVRSPNEVAVRDLVEADGGLRLFAEATYRRVLPRPRS